MKLEIRQKVRIVPSRPIVLATAILAVLALALTTWYALIRSEPTHNPVFHRAPVTTVTRCGGLVAPDTLERCQEPAQSPAVPHSQ